MNSNSDFAEDIVSDNMLDSMIPWYDVLDITLEELRDEMSQNPPESYSTWESVSNSHEDVGLSLLSSEDQSEFLCSLSPEELASNLVYDMDYRPLSSEEQTAFELECPQKHTPEESREIRKRLMKVKHPDDLICSDHGEIYLDISWRDKSVPDDTNCNEETVESYEDFMISPASIIGDDNRVKPSNTNIAPLNYTALIIMYYYDSDGRGVVATGSAFFVAKNLLLTAGHCAYSPDFGEPYKIEIYPGGYESGISKKVSYKTYANESWLNGTAPFDDYGTIWIAADVSSGFFILNAPTTSSLTSADIHHYGYPRDKPSIKGGNFYELWISYGSTSSDISKTYFLHNADEVKGNSGGPIILSGNKKVAGINAASLLGYDWNAATRITSEVIQFVNKTK